MDRRILIIDDDRSLCEVLESELRRREFEVTWFTDPHAAIAVFEREDFGLAITDVNMAGMNGVELCKQLVGRREDMPVIVITAYANMETAIAAIRAGAYDFVTKPFDMDELALTIERALRHRALREEVKRLRKEVDSTQRFEEILGTSAAMLKMCELITRVADTETTVLITGESGTGKELVAKALHTKSGRRDGPSTARRCRRTCSRASCSGT
jgi:two-component system response regulator AtoC